MTLHCYNEKLYSNAVQHTIVHSKSKENKTKSIMTQIYKDKKQCLRYEQLRI